MSVFNRGTGSDLFPVDTLSVAMTAAPKSIPVVSSIFKISTDIRETSQRVAANRDECQKLSERIDTIIGFLADGDVLHSLNATMHMALSRFESFLCRCLEFITTFIDTSWMRRIINNKDHEKKFQDLHRELTQYSNDLNFGIGIHSVKSRHSKQMSDSPNDRADKSNAIVEQMSSDEVETKREKERISNKSMPKVYPRPEEIFVSGLWNYRYTQDNEDYGPFPCRIAFDINSKTIEGFGEDNIGEYTFNGSVVVEKFQMNIEQQYILGTGDPVLNFGHQETIDLVWNSLKKIFQGCSYTEFSEDETASALVEMWYVKDDPIMV